MAFLASPARALLSRWKLRRCTAVGRGVVARGRIWIHGGGEISIGDDVTLDGATAPIELHAAEGAEISIGAGARVDGGASIESARAVRVGARAHVGTFCKILDNHFHRVGDRGARPPSSPVIVEEDADLGPRSILLPGAHIGRSAIVGAATVVTRRVPDGSTLGGLPATLKRG